ncbi:hypothetical protein [Flammeovirga pacifica]|uniref:Uncharacterized protein n=1 Tax=Flammeovirga pacifica TaxID=915059 RepID=A0A1S1YV39_FLAPC|nr:hypothetical protein [Flammeovirga pacifica]OHX64881.1 hypothetical protein NH26_00245 [Flammeovirga pacifica]
MKHLILTVLTVFTVLSVSAKKFEVKFANKSAQQIQLFYQIIKDVEKEEPKFIFKLDLSQSKSYTIKLKRGQKVKFIGYGSGVETLPVIREFNDLNNQMTNEIELVLPKVEKLNIVELNEVLAKLGNDNVLNVLLDSNQYVNDKMPPLGAFIFYNSKKDKTLTLKPTFWKNENDLRIFDNKYFDIIDHVSSANSASLGLSGIPFLNKLGASFQNSNLLEIIWEIENAHFKQWQPTDNNVFQIIADSRNSGFINSCVTEMNTDSLAGGDYKLFFVSSIYGVDRIKVSAKKYNKININAEVNFSEPVTPNVEVIKPIQAEATYGYMKEKLYHNVDSSLNLSLRVLVLDYTSALNTHISTIAKQAQKVNAENSANRLKGEIVNLYTALKSLDSTLINTQDVEVIIPIVDITPDKILMPLEFDSLGNEITPLEVSQLNTRINQFNSLLSQVKEKNSKFKDTLISIENLSQPTDYYRIVQSTNPAVLDKRVLNAYLKSQN